MMPALAAAASDNGTLFVGNGSMQVIHLALCYYGYNSGGASGAIGSYSPTGPLRQTTCRPNRNVTYGGDQEMTWVDIHRNSKIEL